MAIVHQRVDESRANEPVEPVTATLTVRSYSWGSKDDVSTQRAVPSGDNPTETRVQPRVAEVDAMLDHSCVNAHTVARDQATQPLQI